VDDNPQVLLMLKDIIPEKYGLHLSNSGSNALEILDKEKIDLVISDVIMPEIDGLKLCQRIKDSIETSHIPVILLTEKAEIEHRIEGLQVGADSYIPKPFHPDHLLVRVEKLIQTREKLRSKFKTLANTGEEVMAHGLGKKDEEFITKVVEYIQKEMNNPELDAIHIASYINMSKTSLYKKIKSITGLSPHLLINQYRLKKAAQLLKNSEMNVSEIIDEIGFNSRSYFYKSFNEMFNCSPKDFK
jgi:YesN/AraC family two-component response regulator